MESELLRIKCPNCGAVLTIKKIAGLKPRVFHAQYAKRHQSTLTTKFPNNNILHRMKMMTPPWEMKPTLTIQKIRVSANFRKLAQVICILYP